MEYKYFCYKGQTIVSGIDGCKEQVYFRGGERSKVVSDAKRLVDEVLSSSFYECCYKMMKFDRSGVELTTANIGEFIGRRVYVYAEDGMKMVIADVIGVIEDDKLAMSYEKDNVILRGIVIEDGKFMCNGQPVKVHVL